MHPITLSKWFPAPGTGTHESSLVTVGSFGSPSERRSGHNAVMEATVAAWFEETANPMAHVMRAVRDLIMEDPDISECIKYRAPAFESDGLMCYFNWSSKKRVSLIFPSGRTIPGDHPELEDGSNVQRMMYFADLDDVANKADALHEVIEAWHASRR